MRSFVYLFSIISLNFNLSNAHSEKEYSLLLLSFDGFRWDYLTKFPKDRIPNFQKMKASGVWSKDGVKNVFPTNTLPNHWSMVTGLYPENHGVLDNFIKDPNISKPFIPKFINPDYRNDYRYYDAGGEPIWVTNQKQKGRSGSIMWWGSEDLTMRPTFVMPYDVDVSSEKKIDTIIDWFKSKYPINLGLIYFPEPDLTEHAFGPDSEKVIKLIEEADKIIGYLQQKLKENDMLDDINIIVTSDHGFSSISKEHVIRLDKIISLDHFEYLGNGSGPMSSVAIFSREGQEEKLGEVYDILNNQSESLHFKVFQHENIPERFHYKNNKRAPSILALADPPYSFIVGIDTFSNAGNHGYDNELADMHPFFLATGPAFKEGFVIDTFSTVDIYPLMCHLLGLQPAPNNGSMNKVSQLLKEKHENSIWTFGTYILVLIVTGSIGGVFTVAACRHHRYLKRRMTKLQATIKYSTPTGNAKTSLLAEEEEEEDEFDDAKDDDKMLQIITSKW